MAITFPPRSSGSLPAEDGLALLEHRPPALAGILAAARRLDGGVAVVVRNLLARRECLRQERLDARQRERRVVGQGARERRRRLLDVRRRHHLVHHADGERAPRVDQPAGEQQVARVGRADDLEQLLGQGEARHETDTRQRHAEPRALGGDSQVAVQRELAAAGDGDGEQDLVGHGTMVYHPGAGQGERMKLIYEVNDRVARITINRPEAMNAMDADVYAELSKAWIDVRDNPDVWIAIVTGAGDKAFTAGADLKSFIPGTRGKADFWLTQKNMILNRGLEVWKPIIAAVNGYCLAGGMTLLFATDVRIAAEHAVFEISEVKRGILPGNGGTQRALRQLPYAIAMEMLLLGRRLTAAEALGYGLVNRVVPMKDLMSTAEEYARRLCDNGPLALRAVKELAIRSQSVPLEHGLRLEESFQELLRTTEDAKEGPRAFAEKRKAAYKAQ